MILHDLLIILGFTELPGRPRRYGYKGVTGRLNDDGTFQLHGFSMPISQAQDLQYIQMLIDYQQPMFPASSNN